MIAHTTQRSPHGETVQPCEWWMATTDKQQLAAPYVRIAQLEVDPKQLPQFKAALQENAVTSVRVESGVYALHAVAHKDNPHRFLVFEMYESEAAYSEHRNTPHFQKFFDDTQAMVTSRTFLEVDAVVLSAKAHWNGL